jgi:hypothetical protein
MSFDRQGVLLATGDDRGNVRLYDFDDVRSADARGRNALSRSSVSHWRRLTMMRDSRAARGWVGGGGCAAGEEGGATGEAASSGAVDEAAAIDPPEGRRDDDGNDSADGGVERPPSTESSPAALVRPVLSFRCGARRETLRISGVLWSPNDQDHLVVSFA